MATVTTAGPVPRPRKVPSSSPTHFHSALLPPRPTAHMSPLVSFKRPLPGFLLPSRPRPPLRRPLPHWTPPSPAENRVGVQKPPSGSQNGFIASESAYLSIISSLYTLFLTCVFSELHQNLKRALCSLEEHIYV